MPYDPVGFRALAEGGEPLGLRAGQAFTLILVKAGGRASYGRTVGAKVDIKRDYVEGEDLLLLAWTGRYYTAVFRLSAEDVERHW